MIRLLLIDDREIVLAGWRMRLQLEPDMEIAGEAADLETALKLTAGTGPDIVLLDVRMGEAYSLDWIPLLQSDYPSLRIIVVTAYDSEANRARALAQGAAAFVSKELPFDELLATIRRTAGLKPAG